MADAPCVSEARTLVALTKPRGKMPWRPRSVPSIQLSSMVDVTSITSPARPSNYAIAATTLWTAAAISANTQEYNNNPMQPRRRADARRGTTGLPTCEAIH